MKLYQTQFWQNYHQYKKIVKDSTMRCTVDAYVYYKIFKKYSYKNFLEIGFYEGQTAGLIAEITSHDAVIDCVDPAPKCHLYNTIYSDLKHKINLHVAKSQDFNFKPYEVIIIDGDKTFSSVSTDMQNSIKNIASSGMILVNEYQKTDVKHAIEKFLLPNHLVPFLQTDQTLFFHFPHNNLCDFLDFELPDPGNNFIKFENKELWGSTVLTATTLPIFTDRIDFFDMALKEFDV